MRGALIAILSAVTLMVAAFGLSGCSSDPDPASSPSLTTSATAAPPAPPEKPFPPPDALTDVLNRLADPDVPGAQKVALIEHGVPGDGASLDRFTQALRDNGFLPVSFNVHDLTWSQSKPDNVVATVDVTAGDKQSDNNFSFPMEFTPAGDGWQLTRSTADQVLQFNDSANPPAPPPPPR